MKEEKFTPRYKLPRPEDFIDVENYVYKLSRAYSVLYSDMLITLVHLEALADMIGVEYTELNDIKERIDEILKPYINSNE